MKAYADEDGSPNVESAMALRNVRGHITDFVALEVLVAIGKKHRARFLSRSRYRTAVAQFLGDFPGAFDVMPADRSIRSQALRLAERYHHTGTSAMDLLHLASALQAAVAARPYPIVLVCADRPLIEAAEAEGLSTYNPETQPLAALRSALRLRN